MPKASDVADKAADWIQRRDFWSWSAADQEELDLWLSASLAHRIAYHRLDSAWARTARLTALRPSAQPEEPPTKPSHSAIVRMAAALIIVGLLGAGGASYYLRTPEVRYETHIGEHKTVMLADGSRVELNTNTALRVSVDRRAATLEHGEAYFRIKHNVKHPFSVIADDHRITDIGTEFLVRSDSGRFEVTLVEGRAKFDASGKDTQSPIVLVPGDRLVVANNLIRATHITLRGVTDTLGWRRGMLIFDDTPLGDVAAEFNRYNTEKIVIAEQRVASIRISASFRTNGVEDLTQLAQAMLGLRVQRLEKETVISR
jgi:transmembrane sensor